MSFSLDRERIYIECPRCNFHARPFLRQVRHQDVMICGGCKANIWLVDYIGQFQKAEGQVHQSVDSSAAQFCSLFSRRECGFRTECLEPTQPV